MSKGEGRVFWFVLTHFVAFFVDVVGGTRPGNREKDLQILVLRHQVRLLQRQRPRPPRLTRGEKLTLAVLAAALARLTAGPRHQLDQHLLLFKPDTILKWHRELARRTWTFRRTKRGGRPTIPTEVEGLILRLARENPRWGHRRIQGELGKLGQAVSASAVRAALRRHRLPPAPQRQRATTWRDCINRHKDHLLAGDFFTVETLFLKTIHVLFFRATRGWLNNCPA
jgi:putative transposase